MKKAVQSLNSFDADGRRVNVIVETPKGSRVKYAFNPENGLLDLSRVLPEGMIFPFNFGFIPATCGGDGDPLDIVILNQEPLTPGCLVKAQLLALIKARQTENGKTVRNDRLIGVAVGDELKALPGSIQLDKKMLGEIEFFFTAYHQLQGRKFKTFGTSGPKSARKMVEQSTRRRRNGR